MNSAFWIRAGGVLMFLTVATGAFGAHGLKNFLSDEMKNLFETGARCQAHHSPPNPHVTPWSARNIFHPFGEDFQAHHVENGKLREDLGSPSLFAVARLSEKCHSKLVATAWE